MVGAERKAPQVDESCAGRGKRGAIESRVLPLDGARLPTEALAYYLWPDEPAASAQGAAQSGAHRAGGQGREPGIRDGPDSTHSSGNRGIRPQVWPSAGWPGSRNGHCHGRIGSSDGAWADLRLNALEVWLPSGLLGWTRNHRAYTGRLLHRGRLERGATA